jgi:signal peptidase II
MTAGPWSSGWKGFRPSWVPWYKDWVLISVIWIVFTTDQLTKHLVRSNLGLGESIPSGGAFRIINAFNTGSAFGLFQDQTFPLILASIAGISILIIVYRKHSLPGPLLRLSLGLQLGGAFGNLVDRLRLEHVTDFIRLGFWPVFNVADASIVVGIVILAWLLIKSKRDMFSRTDGVRYQRHGTTKGGIASPNPFLCPLCDSYMITIPKGWRCLVCGAREWIDSTEKVFVDCNQSSYP